MPGSQLSIFPSDLATLERMDRLGTLRRSYLFAGFDRTLCVLLKEGHSRIDERRVDDQFSYLEIGFKREGLGRAGMLLGLAARLPLLYQRAREARVDAVVACDPHLLGLVGYSMSRLLRVPFGIRLVFHYGLKYEHLKRLAFPPFRTRQVERGVEGFLMRAARGVMVAGPCHRDYIRDVAGDQATVLPFVIGQSEIFYQEPLRDPSVAERFAPGAKKRVVLVSRLIPEKYPQDFVSLAARFRDDRDVAFLIAGEGPMRAQLEEEAARSGARVTFTGMLPQDQIRALFATADAVVIFHGGGAHVEALLSAAPIVAYDFDVNAFVMRPGYDEGLIVPFRDVDALAQSVRRLLDHPAEAQRFARRGRASALERFSDASARQAERAAADYLLGLQTTAPDDTAWQLTYDPDAAPASLAGRG